MYISSNINVCAGINKHVHTQGYIFIHLNAKIFVCTYSGNVRYLAIFYLHAFKFNTHSWMFIHPNVFNTHIYIDTQ